DANPGRARIKEPNHGPWTSCRIHHRRLPDSGLCGSGSHRLGGGRPCGSKARAGRSRTSRNHPSISRTQAVASKGAGMMTLSHEPPQPAPQETVRDMLRESAGRDRRVIVLLPLAIFLGLAVLFFLRLGAGDASRIPSALIGREAPATDLPPVAG